MSVYDMPANLPGWPLQEAQRRFSVEHHGDYSRWADALHRLPSIQHVRVSYGDTVSIYGEIDNQALEACLQELHPWRKGPFQVGDVFIDTEWRSDWKWSRLAPHLGRMTGRVLDIGCGNGYFGWRMLAAGADEVVGIDPTLLFCMQHQAISHFTSDPANWVLPLKIEEIPTTVQFDTVLSMGVIYHRRDPAQHTAQLAALTRPGGRVVLESLIVETQDLLVPEGRYARMRNVWCVPSTTQMCQWLADAGLTDIEVVDVTRTTTQEQRSTPWMRFESLAECLDPQQPGRTVEGHPAPVRAIVTARKLA